MRVEQVQLQFVAGVGRPLRVILTQFLLRLVLMLKNDDDGQSKFVSTLLMSSFSDSSSL